MLRFLRFLVIVAALVLAVSQGFQWYFSVPELSDRVDSTARDATQKTRLGAGILPLMAQNPGTSGVVALQDGQVAFAARILLADAAEDSIDIRYYIWQKDATGLLLLEAIQRAADRGVRVRLLLDDNGTPDLDPELAEMNAHPNIEIRLFNPFILRQPRMVSLALDFSRLNRRMHNKSFTVDGIVTIVGGRNIGDIYFSHSEDVNYFDLDVVALGDAAGDVSRDFDLYWASPSAVPVALLLAVPVGDGGVLAASVAQVKDTQGAIGFAASVHASDLMDNIWDGTKGFQWAEMQMVSDDPSKGQGPISPDLLMINRLGQILGTPAQTVELVSAYFVPGDRLVALLSGWARQGVQVKILTNAQESTDVLPVHSGYLKYRDDLLDAGVQLFELKSNNPNHKLSDVLDQFGLTGESRTSLHAKAFIIDQSQLFIGSFNFDPRSANLNTEMGFLIKNSEVSKHLYQRAARDMHFQAYHVLRAADGGTEWREVADGTPDVIHATEPGTTAFSRALVRFIGWLPVIWLM